MNHAVKRRSKVGLKELIQMTSRVVTNHIFEQMKSWNEAGRRPLQQQPDAQSFSTILRLSLSVYSVNLLVDQLKLAQEYALATCTHSVDLDSMSCSCGFQHQYALTCRHLMNKWLIRRCSLQSADLPPTIEQIFNADLKSELAQVCLEASHPRWTHHATLRVIGEDIDSLEQDHHHDLHNHHEVISSRPDAHVPETQLMIHLEVDDLIARIKEFSLKNDMASRILIIDGNEFVRRLEEKLFEQMRQPSASSGDIPAPSRAIESVLIDKPDQRVDPINRKRDMIHAGLSTSQEAKAKRPKH